MPKIIDLRGKTFGRLAVVERADLPTGGDGVKWKCLCSCGKKVVASSANLRKGRHRSCGCAPRKQPRRDNRGRAKVLGPPMTAVPLTGGWKPKVPAWISWQAMWSRCVHSSCNGYELYGGRGVRVCERWQDFRLFLEDMGERPKGFQLDRIDSDGHYSPENCRWLSPQEQARNQRSNYMIEWKGKRKCLSDWAKAVGIKHSTLHRRIRDYGWSVERALTEPVEEHKKK